ncbi:hypothetical protein T492DRAFT_950697 [Pavlovales sp. CCMP2436]|nr:hypothetical protein T492DRAFT_950697 [Pavlovales sp. CCMP2436]
MSRIPNERPAMPAMSAMPVSPPTEKRERPLDPTHRFLRVRGLPYSATKAQVRDFFTQGITLELSDVALRYNASGEAFVRVTAEQLPAALALNKGTLGKRYLEIFETEQAEYERCESSSTPDGSKVLVRLRGLPWGVTVEDLAGFFSGHTLVSTAILTRSGGRQQTGEAYVELDSEAAASAAMVLHRKELRGRYIELFLATKGEMLAVVAATDGPPPGTPGGAGSEEERRVVKVRGIPWASTAADVAGFFLGLQLAGGQADGTGAHPAVVMIPGADGRASGEALVAFADAVAATAALKRDKHQLGNRWVDVMPVTAAEMRARAGGGGDPGRGPPWLEPTWAVAHPLELPPHLSTTLVPTAKVCVRLKGLGAEASEDAITALFRTVTPPVVAAVVRLIYRKGAPSGHAYVLFGSEHDCAAAMRAQPDAHAVLAPNASNAPELVCCSLREMLLVCNRPHHIWGPAQ